MRSVTVLCSLLFATLLSAQSITLVPVATGLDRPVAITHANDARLFIVLQGGRIVVHDGTRVLADPFLNIEARVGDAGNEQGLLGLAFHPRYAENGFFYVDYTNNDGDTVISRFQVSSSNPNRADATTERILLTVDQPYPNHNGGQLAFGPDGYLYIGMGDGGSGGDPQNHAQNLGDLLGKILRIDVTNFPYTSPPNNPFVNRAGARDEIWNYGLRNPWRFSFDRATGELFIADVGQGLREEVSYQPGTSTGGENYGWRRMEGTRCYTPSTNCNPDGSLVLPIIEYDHTNGACSVTGGYVYRGTRHPRLQGIYVYGDFCNGIIWGATPDVDGNWNERVLLDTSHLISTFGEDAAGELYIAHHSRTGGAIYRITDPAPLPPKRRSVRH